MTVEFLTVFFTVLFIGLYAFIRWSEWWLRRRIFRYLCMRHPEWVTTNEATRVMGCTKAAAVTAFNRLLWDHQIITDGDRHRATGMSHIEPRDIAV